MTTQNSENMEQTKDDMIKNDLIQYHKIVSKVSSSNKVVHDEWIAWIEKQGAKLQWSANDEQNLNEILSFIDEEYLRAWLKDIIYSAYEPEYNKNTNKFSVGDYIIMEETGEIYFINKVLDTIYELLDVDGDDYHFDRDLVDKKYRKWTIRDAKPGDILVSDFFIFKFKNIDEDGGVHYYFAREKNPDEFDFEEDDFHTAPEHATIGNVNDTVYHPAKIQDMLYLNQGVLKCKKEYEEVLKLLS
ncbi:hypothetical protein J6O48_14115 [bacterium]|nr:hypothetical protein [bacterium]